MLKRRPRLAGLAGLMLVGSLVAVTGGVAVAGQANAHQSHALVSSGGIHKIKHVVVIMQENRSFDSYFGTYPGADGIPMRNGVPTVCVPDPKRGSCAKPYHDRADLNGGGRISVPTRATISIAGDWMDLSPRPSAVAAAA